MDRYGGPTIWVSFIFYGLTAYFSEYDRSSSSRILVYSSILVLIDAEYSVNLFRPRLRWQGDIFIEVGCKAVESVDFRGWGTEKCIQYRRSVLDTFFGRNSQIRQKCYKFEYYAQILDTLDGALNL